MTCIAANTVSPPTPPPSKPENPHYTVKHHIKWVTNQTSYPIKLSLPIDDALLNETTNWDWLKLSKNKLVTQLPGLFDNILVTESDSASNLYILNYDNVTHAELSTYEPTIVNHVGKDSAHLVDTAHLLSQKDLFSLAYMKSHAIRVRRVNDTLKVKCMADFYVAKFVDKDEITSETLITALMAQMEKNAIFKIAIKSTTKEEDTRKKEEEREEYRGDEEDNSYETHEFVENRYFIPNHTV